MKREYKIKTIKVCWLLIPAMFGALLAVLGMIATWYLDTRHTFDKRLELENIFGQMEGRRFNTDNVK